MSAGVARRPTGVTNESQHVLDRLHLGHLKDSFGNVQFGRANASLRRQGVCVRVDHVHEGLPKRCNLARLLGLGLVQDNFIRHRSSPQVGG